MVPSVVEQEQPRSAGKDDAALPNREERQVDHSRNPAPPRICQSPSGAGAEIVSQTSNPLQPVLNQQQVR